MRTIRRLVYREILQAVSFVALAFLLLFLFFDLVDQIGSVQIFSRQGYTLGHAFLYVLLKVPSRLYEVLPIAVLIGTIYVLARLAETSQYTILRTSGLGPLQALRMLSLLGLVLVLLTFALGDYVAPAGNRMASLLQARFMGNLTVGRTGAWLKDQRDGHNYSINVGALTTGGQLQQVRIFGFDTASGDLDETLEAATAEFSGQGWLLHHVLRRDFTRSDSGDPQVRIANIDTLLWPTPIGMDMIAAALLDPDRMKAVELFRYVRHLERNGQSAQRYEIELWRKVFYPLGCLVMMVLALPFAYLHFRTRNIAGLMFAGILVGISFFLLNNVFGFIGNLREWTPWLTAALPGLLYSALSLAAFSWLVLRR